MIPGLIEMVQNWNHDVEDVAGLEDKEQELLVVLAKLPKEYQEFLKVGQKLHKLTFSSKVTMFSKIIIIFMFYKQKV